MARKPTTRMNTRVVIKVTQLRILVVVGSKVVPRARKARPVVSSASISARPMGL